MTIPSTVFDVYVFIIRTTVNAYCFCLPGFNVLREEEGVLNPLKFIL